MVDPLTTISAGLAVLGSKDLMNKLLGPSADYIGGEIKHLVERCNVNLDRVFQLALRKLGPRADEPGSVSPRVLKHVMDEGRFCDDPLTAEYLGGVLASSKSEVSRDDRGLFYLDMIESLSSYQLRTHYLLYAAIVRAGKPLPQDLSYWFDDDTIAVAIPETEYRKEMGYSDQENHDHISYHAFLGLEMKGLLEGGTRVVTPDSNSDFNVPFRFFWPTRYGFELFLWGLGRGDIRPTSYFALDPQVQLPSDPGFVPLAIELGKRYFH